MFFEYSTDMNCGQRTPIHLHFNFAREIYRNFPSLGVPTVIDLAAMLPKSFSKKFVYLILPSNLQFPKRLRFFRGGNILRQVLVPHFLQRQWKHGLKDGGSISLLSVGNLLCSFFESCTKSSGEQGSYSRQFVK